MDPAEELARVPQMTKIRSVLCASICNFMIGAYYFFSNINSYVAAYLNQYDSTVTSKDTLLIMPLYIVMQSLGSILSIKLSSRYGYVMVSNISYAIFGLSSLAMVFCTGYWTFIFLYGFLNGLVIGTGYMPALCIAWTYFPDKKSIITGISLFTGPPSGRFVPGVTDIKEESSGGMWQLVMLFGLSVKGGIAQQ